MLLELTMVALDYPQLFCDEGTKMMDFPVQK